METEFQSNMMALLMQSHQIEDNLRNVQNTLGVKSPKDIKPAIQKLQDRTEYLKTEIGKYKAD